MKIKDSGKRREFTTGAVRDVSEGKGRCDLLPLHVVGDVLNLPELRFIEAFKQTKDTKYLIRVLTSFSLSRKCDIFSMLLEVSKHFEAGADKYGENNWKKGIPLHCYLDSGVRHFLQYLRGDKDEPHERAFVWNILCAIWTYSNKPELDDVEMDLVTKT